MTTKVQFVAVASLVLAACSSSTTTNPPQDNLGGSAGSGGLAGSSAQAGAGAGGQSAGQGGLGGAGLSGAAGVSGGAGGTVLDAPKLCEEACGRVAACEGVPSFTVDMPACTAKCVLEVTGQGESSQEIAQMFYEGMRDSPDGCSYPSANSKFWGKFGLDPESYKILKEPNVLQECVDAFGVCYPGGNKEKFNPSCFEGHYRYGKEIRQKKSDCLKQVCPDSYYCWSGASLPYAFWVAGITQVQ